MADRVPGRVDRVRLRREREVAGGLGQGQLAFRRAEEVVGLLGVERQAQRGRIRVAHVLRGEAHEPARHVERVLARLEHAAEPVERAVGIGVAQRLVERGDQVVVLLARLVVEQGLLLHRVAHRRLGHAGRPDARRRELEDVERGARVAVGEPRDEGQRFRRRGGVGCRRARAPGRRARAPGWPRGRPRRAGGARRRGSARGARALTSNDGFSVVAPISTMVPFSTWGRKASCCARLKRWISSTKRIVRCPRRPPSASASVITWRISLTPETTAENGTKRAPATSARRRASVVLPVPGGPHRIIEWSWPSSRARRRSLPGADQLRLAHDLVEAARPHAVGERRGRLRGGGRRRVEQVHARIIRTLSPQGRGQGEGAWCGQASAAGRSSSEWISAAITTPRWSISARSGR